MSILKFISLDLSPARLLCHNNQYLPPGWLVLRNRRLCCVSTRLPLRNPAFRWNLPKPSPRRSWRGEPGVFSGSSAPTCLSVSRWLLLNLYVFVLFIPSILFWTPVYGSITFRYTKWMGAPAGVGSSHRRKRKVTHTHTRIFLCNPH